MHLFHSQKPFMTVSNNFLLSIYKNSVWFLFTSKGREILIKPNLVEMFELLEEMWLTITHHILRGYYRNLIVDTENHLHLPYTWRVLFWLTHSFVRIIFGFSLWGSIWSFNHIHSSWIVRLVFVRYYLCFILNKFFIMIFNRTICNRWTELKDPKILTSLSHVDLLLLRLILTQTRGTRAGLLVDIMQISWNLSCIAW